MSQPRKLRHGEAKPGEQLFSFAADHWETSFRSRPRAVSPGLDTTRHGKGSLGSPWGWRGALTPIPCAAGRAGGRGRGRSAPGGPTSAPETGPGSPAFPLGLREGSPSAGESAAAPPSQPAVIYLFPNQGGRPTPFRFKLETTQVGAPSPSRLTPQGGAPGGDHKRAAPPPGPAGARRRPGTAHPRRPGGGASPEPSGRSSCSCRAVAGPRGGCCRAPRGAQLVGTGRRCRPGGPGGRGSAPGFPSAAASPLPRRKASGFWRERLGASPDFYGNQEGGVKPLPSARLPPSPSPVPQPLLSPPSGCVRFFS